jgi:hypothetical protein
MEIFKTYLSDSLQLMNGITAFAVLQALVFTYWSQGDDFKDNVKYAHVKIGRSVVPAHNMACGAVDFFIVVYIVALLVTTLEQCDLVNRMTSQLPAEFPASRLRSMAWRSFFERAVVVIVFNAVSIFSLSRYFTGQYGDEWKPLRVTAVSIEDEQVKRGQTQSNGGKRMRVRRFAIYRCDAKGSPEGSVAEYDREEEVNGHLYRLDWCYQIRVPGGAYLTRPQFEPSGDVRTIRFASSWSLYPVASLGVTDGYAEGIGPRAGDPRAYCVPPNTSSVAMQDTVAAAINDDVSNFPKDRQLPATSLISAVLSRTFPCVKEPD